MSNFDKNTFGKQASLPWWHWRGLPMRIVALCCAVALVITGAFLWRPDKSAENTDAPSTTSSSLTNEIGTNKGEQPENNGTTSYSNTANNSLSNNVSGTTVPNGGTTVSNSGGAFSNGGTTVSNGITISVTTTIAGTSVSTSQHSTNTDNIENVPLPETPNQLLEGVGIWTPNNTTTTTLPLAPKQWSVLSKIVSGTGFVRWTEISTLGAIAAATPRVSATLGSFGTRIAKRVLVTLENDTNRAAGLTVILNDANGSPICQSITAENGSAMLIYGGKKPHNLEIKQGNTTLEKLPFSETSSTVSLSLELPKNKVSPALDLMIVAETSPKTQAAFSAMSTDLKQVVTNAVNGTSASVRSAAVCYNSAITQTAFSTGTDQTSAFLSNQTFPTSSAKTPSFAEALTKAISLYTWREGATKVLVLMPDKIPVLSTKEAEAVNAALAKAATQGVRVVTLAHANTDTDTELLLRALSFGTGGEFVFRAAKSGNSTITAKPIGTVLTGILTDLLKKR